MLRNHTMCYLLPLYTKSTFFLLISNAPYIFFNKTSSGVQIYLSIDVNNFFLLLKACLAWEILILILILWVSSLAITVPRYTLYSSISSSILYRHFLSRLYYQDLNFDGNKEPLFPLSWISWFATHWAQLFFCISIPFNTPTNNDFFVLNCLAAKHCVASPFPFTRVREGWRSGCRLAVGSCAL